MRKYSSLPKKVNPVMYLNTGQIFNRRGNICTYLWASKGIGEVEVRACGFVKKDLWSLPEGPHLPVGEATACYEFSY